MPTVCWEREALKANKVFKVSLVQLELQGCQDLKDNVVFLVRRAVRVTPALQDFPENLELQVW